MHCLVPDCLQGKGSDTAEVCIASNVCRGNPAVTGGLLIAIQFGARRQWERGKG